ATTTPMLKAATARMKSRRLATASFLDEVIVPSALMTALLAYARVVTRLGKNFEDSNRGFSDMAKVSSLSYGSADYEPPHARCARESAEEASVSSDSVLRWSRWIIVEDQVHARAVGGDSGVIRSVRAVHPITG